MKHSYYNEWAKEKRREYRTENKKMTATKALKEIATDYIPKRIKKMQISENIKKVATKKIKIEAYKMTGIIIGTATLTTLSYKGIDFTRNIETTTEYNDDNDNIEKKYHSIIPIKVIYKVEVGDTLSEIAYKYGITIHDIKVGEKPINENQILATGTEINFTYTIRNDQILYATNQIEKNENIPDYILAYLYHTDSQTINRLNENNLIPNTTLVPNFKGLMEIEKEMEKDYRPSQKTK